MAYVVQDEFWRELGSLHGYLQMHDELFRMSKTPVPGLQVDGKTVVHESARLGSGVHFDGMVCIGAGCDLQHGVEIQRSLVWEQVTKQLVTGVFKGRLRCIQASLVGIPKINDALRIGGQIGWIRAAVDWNGL